MSDPTLVRPLPYDPSFEYAEKDEEATVTELSHTVLGMARTMADHTGHAMRSVHAKSHGILFGVLHVLPLPPQLAQGLFAEPHDYRVIMRISAPPAEELPDSVSTPRGLALKMVGVTGERLPGSEAETTQDVLMVNGPVFGRPGPAGFLKDVKLLATTTDKAPRAKQALSALLRGTEKVLEAVGGGSGTLKSLGGHPQTHPLGETYFSQVPILFGQYMAKLSLAPVSPSLMALKDKAIADTSSPDYLRHAVQGFFSETTMPVEWELRAQLCTDISKMPLEDACVQWPEDESPYVAIARLVLPPQPGWTEQQAAQVDEGMSFNPWHGVTAHRPLGAVMRARRVVYAASAGFRSQFNGCPLHEPKS
ncbi:catalase family protein [soil metagenome]